MGYEALREEAAAEGAARRVFRCFDYPMILTLMSGCGDDPDEQVENL